MTGGSPAAREVADRTVGTNDDGSIARIIEELNANGTAGRDGPDPDHHHQRRRHVPGGASTPEEGQG